MIRHLISGAVLMGLPAAALAQASPSAFVEALADKVVGFMEDQRLDDDEIDVLLEDIDVDTIARFTLGKYGSRLSSVEFEEYREAFHKYIRDELRDQVSQFAVSNISVKDFDSRGEQSIVRTTFVDSAGENMRVNWRLRKSGDAWEVIDINAMGLWLAIHQRDQFLAKLDASNGDIQLLIDTLKDKQA